MTNPFEPEPEESWENAFHLLGELYRITAGLTEPERRTERFALVAALSGPEPEESWGNAFHLLQEINYITSDLPEPERGAERLALVADLKAYLQITYQETPDQKPRPKHRPPPPPEPDPGPRDYRLRDPGEKPEPGRAAPQISYRAPARAGPHWTSPPSAAPPDTR